MTLSSVPAAKCRGLPVGRGQVCGFCGSLCRGLQVAPHFANPRPGQHTVFRNILLPDAEKSRDIFSACPRCNLLIAPWGRRCVWVLVTAVTMVTVFLTPPPLPETSSRPSPSSRLGRDKYKSDESPRVCSTVLITDAMFLH